MNADRRSTVTGSRKLDRIVFTAILVVLVVLSWRLRVYYSAPMGTEPATIRSSERVDSSGAGR